MGGAYPSSWAFAFQEGGVGGIDRGRATGSCRSLRPSFVSGSPQAPAVLLSGSRDRFADIILGSLLFLCPLSTQLLC